jgi:hypothetical protein
VDNVYNLERLMKILLPISLVQVVFDNVLK